VQTVHTVGVDFKVKSVLINGVPRKIQIWDTAGQERFRNITEAYYRKGHGIAIVYDVSDPITFASVPSWFESVKSKCHGAGNIPIVLIGNKADLEQKVPLEDGEQLAAHNNAKFFQTSAKDGSNIDDAFSVLATLAATAMEGKGDGSGTGGLEIATKSTESKGKSKGFSC
jgi:small GTP-binding protein